MRFLQRKRYALKASNQRLPVAPSPRSGAARAALRDRPAKANATPKRASVLSAAQIEQMLAAAGPRDAALVALMTAGALRIGEATLLTWGDIDAQGVVTIQGGTTKTGASRHFALPAAAKAHVEAWRAQCPASQQGWIFPGVPVRNPLGVRTAQHAIQQLAAACGLHGVTSHSFRRSALTAAHEAGLSLRAVAQISGHQSLAALERYLDQGNSQAQAEAARGLLFGQA